MPVNFTPISHTLHLFVTVLLRTGATDVFTSTGALTPPGALAAASAAAVVGAGPSSPRTPSLAAAAAAAPGDVGGGSVAGHAAQVEY
jgi:hypothetical protein